MTADLYEREPDVQFPEAMLWDGTPVRRHDDGMPEHEQWVLDYRRPDGVRHGPYVQYTAPDVKRAVSHARWSEVGYYRHGERHGLLRRFAGHRVVWLEGHYREGLPDGTFRWARAADGVLLDEVFVERGTGRWRGYSETGRLIEEGELLNGLREGTWIERPAEAASFEVRYREGRRQSVRNEGDTRTGTFETHDSVGRTVHAYTLHDGFREGEETDWDEHGHVGSMCTWERGLCLEKEWPRLGERVRFNREGEVVCRWKGGAVVEGDARATLDSKRRG